MCRGMREKLEGWALVACLPDAMKYMCIHLFLMTNKWCVCKEQPAFDFWTHEKKARYKLKRLCLVLCINAVMVRCEVQNTSLPLDN